MEPEKSGKETPSSSETKTTETKPKPSNVDAYMEECRRNGAIVEPYPTRGKGFIIVGAKEPKRTES